MKVIEDLEAQALYIKADIKKLEQILERKKFELLSTRECIEALKQNFEKVTKIDITTTKP